MNLPHNNGNSDPPLSGQNWTAVLSSLISNSAAFIGLAAREWLPNLIDQPSTPPFSYNSDFKEEFNRISRLIAFAIILSVLILGSLSLLFEKIATLTVIKLGLKLLAMGLILAVCYQPFAYVIGVRVAAEPGRSQCTLTLRQILFSVLFIFVPWIPIFT